jgi:hypothetical protein
MHGSREAAIEPLDADLAAEIRRAMREGPAPRLAAQHLRTDGPLRPMPLEEVRLGRRGGLPYEFLSTDLYSGCLPIGALCYANCSLGLVTIEHGFDFGDRKPNLFDEARIAADIAHLDAGQRWIRQGWNSDVSLSATGWRRAARLAELLRDAERHLVLLTKAFRQPEDAVLDRLAAAGVELRISISAIDDDRALAGRLDLLTAYRQRGGIAVPYLMTMALRTPRLRQRQDALLDWIVRGDFPAAEHPLRLNTDNPLSHHLDPAAVFVHPKFPAQRWSGRLYPGQLLLPSPPSLRPSYRGPGSRWHSRVDWHEVSRHFDHGTPTRQALDRGEADLQHPNLHRHGTPSVGVADARAPEPHRAGAGR